MLVSNFIKKTALWPFSTEWKNYFQPKLLLLFCSNLIFKHKCQFNFRQTTLWTVYAFGCWQIAVFSAIHNFYFGQILFSLYRAFCKVAQHKCCLALTLQYFHPSKKEFYFSKTQYSCQQKHNFQIAKDVYKVSLPSNMHIDRIWIFNIITYFLGQDCVHNSK